MSSPCENCGFESEVRVCRECDWYTKKDVEIPYDATNGQVIQAVFPEYSLFTNAFGETHIHDENGFWIENTDWWDAPYKQRGASE